MKKIVRRVAAHTVRSFQCEICGHGYPTKSQALKCEARVKERRKFRKGDLVKGHELYVCVDGKKKNKFLPEGRITIVIGPTLPEYEYEVKWLGARPERLNGHIYLYEVTFECLCGRTRSNVFRTPELVLVKSKNR